jgi:putative hemolysin
MFVNIECHQHDHESVFAFVLRKKAMALIRACPWGVTPPLNHNGERNRAQFKGARKQRYRRFLNHIDASLPTRDYEIGLHGHYPWKGCWRINW